MHPVLLWPKLIEGSVLVREDYGSWGNGYGGGDGDGDGDGMEEYTYYGKGNGWSHDDREGYGDQVWPPCGYPYP